MGRYLDRFHCCAVFVIVTLCSYCQADGAEVVVSADGPVRTLIGARDKVRQMKGSGEAAGTIYVTVRGGVYCIDEPLRLGSQDSGTEAAPVVYQAYKNETVRLIAGREVKGFAPVTDEKILKRFKPECRGSILQADLKAQGITDFGKMVSRGFGRSVSPAGLELFYKGRPMTVARWPNEGWLLIDQVPDGANGGKFTYSEDRPGQWAVSENIWVHGFWTQDWADSYERVKSIGAATKTIETYPPHGQYGYTTKHRFYFLNVLEELDAPGEWYLDRSSGMLYFWPPAPIENEAPIVSIGESVLVMDGCSHVTLKGMTIECTRGNAVRIKDGANNLVEDCVIRNIGNRGVEISGGKNNGVRGCEIYHAGDGGVSLYGGDQKTLTPAGLFAEDNHIHHYNRWCLTYRPAVEVGGVGNRVAHNRIHDGPHNAIQLGGNDHLVEYNEIFNVCTQSDDVGAFYSGRSWTDRGTVIRYNFFHHIHSAADQYRHGSRVVYLDDAASGFTIEGNVFYKAGSLCAVNVGGGRDNVIKNNVFVDCAKGVLIDTRGVEWAKGHISEGGGWRMYEKLKRVNFDQPPYSVRYPKLATILEEVPAEPRGNVLVNNVAVRTQLLDMPQAYQRLLVNEGNWSTDTDPGFADVSKLDFRLKKDSDVFEQVPEFKAIEFEKIERCPKACRD